MADIPELKKVLDIIEHVEKQPAGTEWNQGTWLKVTPPEEQGHVCNTAMCFAGWKVYLDGYTKVEKRPFDAYGHSDELRMVNPETGEHVNEYDIARYAEARLGLTTYEADMLFYEGNKIATLHEYIDDIEAGRLVDPWDDEAEFDDLDAVDTNV
jgi:hypothetical protein